MKYLGIDYGSKRVGLALSDDTGTVAFPYEVVETGVRLFEDIARTCSEHHVGTVVIGDTRTSHGKANEVTTQLEGFAKTLKEKIKNVSIEWVPEHGTSGAARTSPFVEAERSTQSRKPVREKISVDAHAAALILQRYLDVEKSRLKTLEG